MTDRTELLEKDIARLLQANKSLQEPGALRAALTALEPIEAEECEYHEQVYLARWIDEILRP